MADDGIGRSSQQRDFKSDSDRVLQQAWQVWKAQKNPLLDFWGQWKLFLENQAAKRQAETAAERQWQSSVLSRVLTGWTEYRQRREAAAALLRQWKEKRALEGLNSPTPKPSPSIFAEQDSPHILGPLQGDESSLAGLTLLAASMGTLFEDLQAAHGGDLIIEVQGQTPREESSEPSDSNQSQGVVLYANACIVCQRVPYMAAAVRFALQQSIKPRLPFLGSLPAITVSLPEEECSAGSVRAVLRWAYTGSFSAGDWVEVAETLRAGSYLGAHEVVELSCGWLVHLAGRAGKELERLGRSLGPWRLWKNAADSLCMYGIPDGSRNGNGSWSSGKHRWSNGEENGNTITASGAVPLLGAGNEGATDEHDGGSARTATLRLEMTAEVKKVADFVAGSLAALSGCGLEEEESVSVFLANACPALESVLLVLLQLDLRVESSTLGLLLDKVDELRGTAGESPDCTEDGDSREDGLIDAGVLALLQRWWALHPCARLESARALLDEHVSLGALGVARLESLVAQFRKADVSPEAGLLGQEEVTAAYCFALRLDNQYGKTQRLMRRSIGRWKRREQSRAWQSWQDFCADGLGTSRLVLAKRAMRVWSLRSVARLFEGWRQAAIEGKIEERQRLASWKWKRACQKLLKAKQELAPS